MTSAPPRPPPLRKDRLAQTFKSHSRTTILPEPTATGRATIPLSGPGPASIRHFSWSPLGTSLAGTSNSLIRIWDPEKAGIVIPSGGSKSLGAGSKRHAELRGHSGPVEKVEWNPTREAELASTGADASVKIWDVRAGHTAVVDVKIGDAGLFLTWHPNGRELLVGRRDDVIVPIDVRTAGSGGTKHLHPRPGRKIQTVQANQMAFSNGGREVFAATGEGAVQILDWPSMEMLYSLNAHTAAATCLAHSPNGSYLAVGGGDSLVSLWDTEDWTCKRTLSNATAAIHNLSFSFEGTYICAGSKPDGGARPGLDISHVETGEAVYTIDTVNPVGQVAWHPCDYALAYTGDPGGIRIVTVL